MDAVNERSSGEVQKQTGVVEFRSSGNPLINSKPTNPEHSTTPRHTTGYPNLEMPPISLLPLLENVLGQVPTLLEQVLKTEIKNRAVSSQCIDLQAGIEIVKSEVLHERMKQKIIKDQLAAAQAQAGRHSESSKNYQQSQPGRAQILRRFRVFQHTRACHSRTKGRTYALLHTPYG